VLVLGHHNARLAQARRWGARKALNTSGDDTVSSRAAREVRESCNAGRGADVVFEAVGRAETWQLALSLSRPGGTINLFGGRPTGDSFTMDAFAMHYEERTVLGAFHHTPATFARAIEVIASGAVPTGDLLSGTMPLDQLPHAFARLERGEGIKFAVRPTPVATTGPDHGENS